MPIRRDGGHSHRKLMGAPPVEGRSGVGHRRLPKRTRISGRPAGRLQTCCKCNRSGCGRRGGRARLQTGQCVPASAAPIGRAVSHSVVIRDVRAGNDRCHLCAVAGSVRKTGAGMDRICVKFHASLQRDFHPDVSERGVTIRHEPVPVCVRCGIQGGDPSGRPGAWKGSGRHGQDGSGD